MASSEIYAPSGLRADFGMTMMDDSMTPCIQPGDTVYIRKQDVKNGDLIAVRIGGLCVLRRFHDGGDHIALEPLNCRYESIVPQDDAQSEFQVIGVAVGLLRSLEGSDQNDPA